MVAAAWNSKLMQRHASATNRQLGARMGEKLANGFSGDLLSVHIEVMDLHRYAMLGIELSRNPCFQLHLAVFDVGFGDWPPHQA